MKNAQECVREFHQKFDCPIGDLADPKIIDSELRLKLIEEEFIELADAIATNDLVAATDALGDIAYLILGTAVSWGVSLAPVFQEIHRTNMRKDGGGRREDGKIIKPPDWEPPRIAELLEVQIAAARLQASRK